MTSRSEVGMSDIEQRLRDWMAKTQAYTPRSAEICNLVSEAAGYISALESQVAYAPTGDAMSYAELAAEYGKLLDAQPAAVADELERPCTGSPFQDRSAVMQAQPAALTDERLVINRAHKLILAADRYLSECPGLIPAMLTEYYEARAALQEGEG